MSACELSVDTLIAYADGELDEAWQAEVAGHLATCPRCRQRLAAFAELDRRLHAAYPPLDDPRAPAVVLARLASAAGPTRATGWRRAWQWRWPIRQRARPLAIGLALVLTLSGLRPHWAAAATDVATETVTTVGETVGQTVSDAVEQVQASVPGGD